MKNLKLIHFAFCVELVILAIMALSAHDFVTTVSFDYRSDVLLIVVPVMAMIVFFTSISLGQFLTRKINEQDALDLKLTKYKSLILIKNALLNGAALFSIVAFYLSVNLFYLLFALLLLKIIIVFRPTSNDFASKAKLNLDEIEAIK